MQVHYCGTLDDDSVFDSSHEREPLDFIVGSGKVIPGFDDVVIGMVKGERRKERVEAERAYGMPLACGAAKMHAYPHCLICHRSLRTSPQTGHDLISIWVEPKVWRLHCLHHQGLAWCQLLLVVQVSGDQR